MSPSPLMLVSSCVLACPPSPDPPSQARWCPSRRSRRPWAWRSRSPSACCTPSRCTSSRYGGKSHGARLAQIAAVPPTRLMRGSTAYDSECRSPFHLLPRSHTFTTRRTLQILTKTPEGATINTTDSFSVNANFTCPLRKVRIPLPSLDESATANKKAVEEDRCVHPPPPRDARRAAWCSEGGGVGSTSADHSHPPALQSPLSDSSLRRRRHIYAAYTHSLVRTPLPSLPSPFAAPTRSRPRSCAS
jgi:hypothetical protein